MIITIISPFIVSVGLLTTTSKKDYVFILSVLTYLILYYAFVFYHKSNKRCINIYYVEWLTMLFTIFRLSDYGMKVFGCSIPAVVTTNVMIMSIYFFYKIGVITQSDKHAQFVYKIFVLYFIAPALGLSCTIIVVKSKCTESLIGYLVQGSLHFSILVLIINTIEIVRTKVTMGKFIYATHATIVLNIIVIPILFIIGLYTTVYAKILVSIATIGIMAFSYSNLHYESLAPSSSVVQLSIQ
jgi:hypothetical protein